MQTKVDTLNANMEKLKQENERLITINELNNKVILNLSGEISDLQLENADLKRKIQNFKRGVRWRVFVVYLLFLIFIRKIQNAWSRRAAFDFKSC